MLLSLIISLAGCVLTASQALLIILQGKGICLNDGCEVVDSLTLVPPLYLNIAGFFFFLLVSFGLNQARKGSETGKRFASLVLLAGLAAEAVLVSFQFLIARTFCSYCLIVLALVFFANFFLGIKQIFKGAVIFSAVTLAFISLDFRSDSSSAGSLDAGTISRYAVDASERQLYLFFSSTCTYCEKVIESLREEPPECTISFNPIEPLDSFSFPGAEPTASYAPGVNRRFLQHLGIEEIPVLVSTYQGMTTVLRGEQTIGSYLALNCAPADTTEAPAAVNGQSGGFVLPLPPPQEEEGCSITEECEEPSAPDIGR